MLVYIVVLISFGSIPAAVSSVVKNLTSLSTCRGNEFPCQDGGCISAASVCDTVWDCSDGSDEAACFTSSYSNQSEVAAPHARLKRQLRCGSYQWTCKDGTCIDFDGKCDGKVDCKDKSDETHALCRNMKCQSNWFRCTYGACVDGTAYCNGVVECADQSDELTPRCRNDNSLSGGKFQCADGSSISAVDHCDGTPHCSDGSDETVSACAAQTCPRHVFQCAYGACVDNGSDCNGRKDCADGSDEAEELCNKISTHVFTPTRFGTGQCTLPQYPAHGSYTSSTAGSPGQAVQAFRLDVTCEQGYTVNGSRQVFCHDGLDSPMPTCVRYCELPEHPSVTYNCPGSGGSRSKCKPRVFAGTQVTPQCKKNYYNYIDETYSMKCKDNGHWNNIIICKPECGGLAGNSVSLVGGDDSRPALVGEIPWHVAIYRKPNPKKQDYEQICGGSLVDNQVVITAAHCFWDKFKGVKRPANLYTVAIGKLFTKWDHEDDKNAQKSDVKSIRIPTSYNGDIGNQHQDIALVILETSFEYNDYVIPVCLSFDRDFNADQLKEGSIGKIAGYGLITADGKKSEVLNVVNLPYLSYIDCKKISPENFQGNIGGDKICAGSKSGKAALCKGDSGGGLAFPAMERGVIRYYLRGVASTAPPDKRQKCNIFTFITFTEIREYRDFIRNNIS